MRLLYFKNDGQLALTEDLDKNTEPYAILSHRWGKEGEVLFEDIATGRAATKLGYRKIEFCRRQAARDGLRYFWVDSCCIQKANFTELTTAINSMFEWYRKADRCYVYLSDVSADANELETLPPRDEAAFRASEWFERGWTLQELIAPTRVEFFSVQGNRLGSKTSLEPLLCEVTGIPSSALRNGPGSDHSVTERFLWAARRQTTREEDMAYCLLGIFGVQMPLLYGEGLPSARSRLQEEIERAARGTSINT